MPSFTYNNIIYGLVLFVSWITMSFYLVASVDYTITEFSVLLIYAFIVGICSGRLFVIQLWFNALRDKLKDD